MNKEVIDINVFEDYKKKGLLKCGTEDDLRIWNYTDKTQIKKKWDDVTTVARALVTDSSGNIVARSFNKFHNIEENLHKPSSDFSVYEKMDGSLILLFYYKDKWVVSSRGSFSSEQANKAREIMADCDLSKLDKNVTFNFEIIYPENKIVVDYGDKTALVFLGAFLKDSTEVTDDVLNSVMNAGFEAVKRYEFDDYKAIKELNLKNKEGFIVRFHSTNDRVKIKFENYVILHRYAMKMTEKNVWQLFSTGKPFDECVEGIPDEFFKWFNETWEMFQKKYDTIYDECSKVVSEFSHITDKRNFVEHTKTHKYFHIIIQMYSGVFKPQTIYNLLKPNGGGEIQKVNTETGPIIQNPELPKAIVCDLDGTLCLMQNRDPHQYHKVKHDLVCEPVKNVVGCMKAMGYKIIIATGRPSLAEKDSKDWLKTHGIDYDVFYCRKSRDSRKDYIVKEEMWREMVKKYHIDFMLDDRDQVVTHARALGFKVFQVAEGKF